MKIQQSFSQNAYAYDQVNIIQKRVLERVLEKIDEKPSSLLDIGCGSGGVYKAVDWDLKCFVGMDFAQGMLERHPKGEHVTLLLKDFNDASSFDALSSYTFDRVISSSALQWAEDLDATLARIAALGAPVSLSIFTSNTFKTLYETAGLPPLLRSRESVITLLKKHFDGEIEIVNYTLAFESVREMFRYMKRSGVGAGRNLLGYKEMKKIMETYPLDHLEYEIVLLHQDRINS
jgi:malonyl-CoA O-methyltransferase